LRYLMLERTSDSSPARNSALSTGSVCCAHVLRLISSRKDISSLGHAAARCIACPCCIQVSIAGSYIALALLKQGRIIAYLATVGSDPHHLGDIRGRRASRQQHHGNRAAHSNPFGFPAWNGRPRVGSVAPSSCVAKGHCGYVTCIISTWPGCAEGLAGHRTAGRHGAARQPQSCLPIRRQGDN
jgi:hypothetical protein